MRLRILTLNIQNGGPDSHGLKAVNSELRRIAPDIVAFQEVGDGQLDALLDGTDLLGTHQAQVLAYQPPFADKYGGSAIATRWPHRVVEVLDQRMADANDVPWCTLAALVTLPGIGDLLFLATTLSWRLEAEAARERQAVALADLDARHRTVLPTVIAGDFNAEPTAASIRYLSGLQSLNGRSVHYHDAWRVAGQGPGYTWTVDNPAAREEIAELVGQPDHRRRIDYVFVGSRSAHPKARCEIVAARLAFDQPVEGRQVSDHFGVLVDIEASGEPPESPADA